MPGRPKIEIDKLPFQNAVNLVEKDGPLPNLSKLWAAVSETAWAKSFARPLQPQTIMIRAKELGITTKTIPGKRGGDGNFGGKRGGVKGVKRQPRKNRGMTQEQVDAYMKWVPERAKKPLLFKHLEKAMKGSIKSMLWLHFMENEGFSPRNIRLSTTIGDPLYNFRPYKDEDEAKADEDFEPPPTADENESETEVESENEVLETVEA